VASWRHSYSEDELEADRDHDAAFGKAVLRGAAIGLPVAVIGLTLVVWLITDNDLGDSFATAILPGVLLGVFGGGFVGVAANMD
jgi:ABC-type Mn2+/Zn2+ transport system permease subunit